MSEHALKAIELEQLVKRFGDLTAVDDLRFTVNEGEIFGLLGPNLEPLAPLAETFRKVRSNPAWSAIGGFRAVRAPGSYSKWLPRLGAPPADPRVHRIRFGLPLGGDTSASCSSRPSGKTPGVYRSCEPFRLGDRQHGFSQHPETCGPIGGAPTNRSHFWVVPPWSGTAFES